MKHFIPLAESRDVIKKWASVSFLDLLFEPQEIPA